MRGTGMLFMGDAKQSIRNHIASLVFALAPVQHMRLKNGNTPQRRPGLVRGTASAVAAPSRCHASEQTLLIKRETCSRASVQQR
jgi:hypothetical protein